MGAIAGFFLGYVMGAQAGRDGLAKLISAWREVCASAEVRQALAGAVAVGGGLLQQGMSDTRGPLAGAIVGRAGEAFAARAFGAKAA